MRRLRKFLLYSACLVLSVLLLASLTTWITSGTSQQITARVHHRADTTKTPVPGTARPAGTLQVMTLNLAHGRRDSLNQIFLGRQTIRRNLAKIAAVIKTYRLDAVALQEADHVSFWSGHFDHISFLAAQARLPYSLHGLHVDGLKIRYGTALLTRHAPHDSYSYVFKPSPPTFSKGFVITTIGWPGDPDFKVDLVSVHLDYSRHAIRRQQLEKMLAFLRQRNRPTILMGDFNVDWRQEKQGLYRLLIQQGFEGTKPAAGRQVTFPSAGTRLDWILVSHGLQLKSETILKQNISDHYAVIATIQRKPVSLTSTDTKSTD